MRFRCTGIFKVRTQGRQPQEHPEVASGARGWCTHRQPGSGEAALSSSTAMTHEGLAGRGRALWVPVRTLRRYL